MKKEDYRPLPEYLKIEGSDIEGLGLFAIDDISGGLIMGITHIEDSEFEDGYSRTPLGGFFNHNEVDPNCIVIPDGRFRKLKTLRDIKNGEEITVKYTLYNPTKK